MGSVSEKSSKKKFSLFKRKKKKMDRKDPDQKEQSKLETTTTLEPNAQSSEQVQEQKDRARLDEKALATADRKSKRGLLALAYATTTSLSFRARGKEMKSSNGTESGKSSTKKGFFSFLNPVHSSFFQSMCDSTFDSIDVDGSGCIDENELYRGLLQIQLKLGLYFGPPACKPIPPEHAKAILEKLDKNNDGALDKEEFRSVLALLMGNVVARIVFQLMCTLCLVPILASAILEHAGVAWGWFSATIGILLIEYGTLVQVALGLDLVVLHLAKGIRFLYEYESVATLVNLVQDYWNAIPVETWDALPLTLLSTMLTLIIVPFAIVQTDDLFEGMARWFGRRR